MEREPSSTQSVRGSSFSAGLAACVALAATVGLLGASGAHAAGAWSAATSMSTARVDHAGVELADGRVLVSGGLTASEYLASAELYDPAGGAWAATGSMGVGRARHTATLLDAPACAAAAPPSWCGKVLVAGGVTRRSAELYDPATGAWTAVADMAEQRASHTATPLGDGRVLVAGGTPTGDLPPIGTTPPPGTSEIFDPATGTWSTPVQMNVPRVDHTATLLLDERVLVAGGLERDGSEDPRPPVQGGSSREGDRVPLRSAEIFDPVAGTWALTQNQNTGRYLHTANLLSSGQLLVAGGDDLNSQAPGAAGIVGGRPFVELFDPGSGSWDADAARWLGEGRSSHTATNLADGRLLAAGGSVGGSPARSAETYDPAAGRWRFTGPLAGPRAEHLAFLLDGPGCAPRCGLVLVAGGRSATASRLATAELYDPSAPTRPGAIGKLTATPRSHSKLALEFRAVGAVEGYPPAAAGYVVKQSKRAITDEQDFAKARSLCGGVCSFSPGGVGDEIRLTVRGLRAATKYHYAVRALDESGAAGPISEDAAARTEKDRLAPGRVKRRSAKVLSAHRVRLRFAAAGSDRGQAPPAREYVVKVAGEPITTGKRFRKAEKLCRPACRFGPRAVGERLRLAVTALSSSTKYHFAIRARDAAGNLGPRAAFRAVRTRSAGR